MLIQVALPVPLYSVFDYRVIGDEMPALGCRVRVPFGRRRLIGIVVAHVETSAATGLKSIEAVLDAEPVLDDGLLNLGYWLAQYYHYPLGDVFAVMLPTLVRQGAMLDFRQRFWRQVRPATAQDFSPSAKKQKQQMALFELQVAASPTGTVSEDQLLLQGIEAPYLQKLQQKGLIEEFCALPIRPAHATLRASALALNAEQQHAVNAIWNACDREIYQGFLLNGITGSGKTEVYLQAMQRVLARGQQVLILVPEIGLTPQTYQRFAARFEAQVLMLHSGLNDTTRLSGWQQSRLGYAQIIIGTRSTILYPFANLGLIIVDEAHDQSYKQQDTLRYHASNVALYRGYQLNCPVILGTATPSLESLHLVLQGKLTQLQLTQRAGDAKPAQLQLIDARKYAWQHGLSAPLIHAMQQTLAKNEQVLVFLNRRGYAPILLCDACGWQADCPRCDAHLTVHLQPVSLLKCHHCDWQQPLPKLCPSCGSSNLDPMGMGTSRLVEGLTQLFANTPVIQIDRDTTRKKDSWASVYTRIAENPSAILVGTQMVAKGHHFPNVTLVAMPNADRGFLSADFRSPEYTAQLITQVAGRAGRADKAGLVLIQTLQPDNPALLGLVRQGYLSFAKQLLLERQLLGLPPYAYACLIRVESHSLEKNQQILQAAMALLPTRSKLQTEGVRVQGPVDAPMAKKNSRFHSQLLILSQHRGTRHAIVSQWWSQVMALPIARYARLTIDIDPISWS